MFLLELIYKRSLEEVDALLDEHKAFLESYYQSGHFIFSGRKVPREGGVILADFASREEAESAIQKDPFLQEGVAEYRVIELTVTRYTDRIANVFEGKK